MFDAAEQPAIREDRDRGERRPAARRRERMRRAGRRFREVYAWSPYPETDGFCGAAKYLFPRLSVNGTINCPVTNATINDAPRVSIGAVVTLDADPAAAVCARSAYRRRPGADRGVRAGNEESAPRAPRRRVGPRAAVRSRRSHPRWSAVERPEMRRGRDNDLVTTSRLSRSSDGHSTDTSPPAST